jgi:NAD-dependent deacetylase
MLDLNKFNHIMILTGAGISAESGISTFRDAGGLWENYAIEDVATPEAFARNPTMVWRFYSMRRLQASAAKPNVAHIVLAKYAAEIEDNRSIQLITQNVDVLHERAPDSHKLEPLCMHGSLNQSRCTHCDNVYYDDYAYFDAAGNYAPQETTLCDTGERASVNYLHHYRLEYRNFLPLSPCCQASIRPNIVWFGEVPMHLDKIFRRLEKIDLFISIGTSGLVYPAASFAQIAKAGGAKTACLNLEPLPQNDIFDYFIQGKAGTTVPQIFIKR